MTSPQPLEWLDEVLDDLIGGARIDVAALYESQKLPNDYLDKHFIKAKSIIAARIEQAVVQAEIKAKIEVLDKAIMGAGEYHDDPYEYVVPIRHLREYRVGLAQFDLSEPIYRDKAQLTQESEKES